MIITRTPYRVSFFGGGTDYRPWFEEHGGLVIVSAMARYLYISIRALPPFFEHKSRIVYGDIEVVNSHQEIHHPSVRHCLAFLKINEGLEIHYDGDLPARSGIGSSSSFTVGLLNGLHGFRHKMVTKRALADEAIEVEHELIQENVGIQDQIIAAFGGLQIIEMGKGNQYRATPLILPPDYLKWIEQHVLLGFTGINRYANQYAEAQIQNIQLGHARDHLTEIHAIAKEGLNLFIQNASLKEVGHLLDQSWKIKRRLAQGVTNSNIDELYEAAKKSGAFGGKLMGAGGGGFVMFLAPPEKHEAIREALSQIKVWVPFSIDMTGSQVIFHSYTD